MSPWEKAIVATEIGLAAAILVGLLVRGHWRSCYSFALYLAAFVVFEGHPRLAGGSSIYPLAKEAVRDLEALVAFEIAARFERLPAARSTLPWPSWSVSGIPAVAPAWAPTSRPWPRSACRACSWDRAHLRGIAWRLLLYHVPLPDPQGVLIGSSPTWCLHGGPSDPQTLGWEVRGSANYLNTVAFVSLAFWTRAAWRRLGPRRFRRRSLPSCSQAHETA
jgi:hypothetical protein